MKLSILPEKEQALVALAAGRAVTLQASVVNDILSPIAAFQKLAAGYPDAYLLESVEGGERIGRLSMLGLGAVRRFSYRDGIFTIRHNGDAAQQLPTDKPLDELRRAFRAVPVEPAHIGVRFAGGAVGYIGYETVRTFEDIELKGATAFGSFPELDLRVAETVLVFDRVLNRLHLLTYVFPGGDSGAAYDAAAARLQAMREALAAATAEPLPLLPVAGSERTPIRGQSNQTREQYENAVRRALEYIRAGDIFQMVPSQRWQYPLEQEPLHIYRCLRAVNPSPYMFFIKMDNARYLIGSSPEILVRLEGKLATVRPIAGTRPRGKNEAEDARLAEELRNDPKECAEHVMLVDLGRNDLGRVCCPGTVRPAELMVIEKYSHVMHIVSEVTGELRDDCDAFALLAATFPAGTVSGAPKIRAMQIINELEPEPRGPYAGAVGYVGFDGNLDTCIALRTMFVDGDKLYLQAGAGIVADSDPASEWEETVNKARGMQLALDWAAASQ